jgi:hypothetical protein
MIPVAHWPHGLAAARALDSDGGSELADASVTSGHGCTEPAPSPPAGHRSHWPGHPSPPAGGERDSSPSHGRGRRAGQSTRREGDREYAVTRTSVPSG